MGTQQVVAPINPFEDPMDLPNFNRPTAPALGGLPAQFQSAPEAPTDTGPSANQKALSVVAPIAAGFGSGSQVQPTVNAPSAVMQAVGSGVSGAATGAALGSVIPGLGTAVGAGVGGLVGLVSGGIQSYFGLQDARASKRAQERAIAKIQKQNDDAIAYTKQQNALARSDTQEQLRYNRHQAALDSQMTAFKSVLALLNNGITQDQNMKELFIQRGR